MKHYTFLSFFLFFFIFIFIFKSIKHYSKKKKMTKVGIVERAISDIYGKIQTGFKCIIKNHLKKMNEKKKKSKIFLFLFTSIARDGGI